MRRLELEEELRHRTLHDPLTGLPNRVLLLDRLEQALRRAPRVGEPVSVLFVDLDKFKGINDALGHTAGDRLLQEVAARLRAVARADDTIAHLSGDEFVMVCERTGPGTALDIARRMVDTVARPYRLEDRHVEVTASVGVVTSEHDTDAEELLRRADMAMYRAKERGPGRLEVYDGMVLAHVIRGERIDRDLRGALERGELSLLYQPIVQAAGTPAHDAVVGAEALLRWQHPVDGPVPPAHFVPVAESRGLIRPIGQWVLAQACAQAARWRAQLPEGATLLVAVNLSVQQLVEPDFAASFVAAALAAGARPEDLVVELTESAFSDSDRDPLRLTGTLLDLRSCGVRVALDDFGTGHASLTHLRTLPLDILKIDGSFVAGLGAGGRDQAIVAAVASLTRQLGVQVVAEGVGTHEQLGTVRDLGFDFAQGHLLGRPMRPAGIADLLPAAGRPTTPKV